MLLCRCCVIIKCDAFDLSALIEMRFLSKSFHLFIADILSDSGMSS